MNFLVENDFILYKYNYGQGRILSHKNYEETIKDTIKPIGEYLIRSQVPKVLNF